MKIEHAALAILLLGWVSGCGPTQKEIARLTQPYIALCGQYLRAGNAKAALESCKKAEEIDDENPDLFTMIGIIYASQKKYGEAEKYYLNAIEISPNHPQAHTNYGSMLSESKKYEQAIEHYKTALADPSSNTFILHMNYGSACMEMKDYVCAEDHLGRALRESPQACMANLRMGELYEQLRRYPDAIERYEACVKNCSNSALCRFRLGESNLQQNRVDSALEQFGWICEKLPASAESVEACKYVRIYRHEVK